MSEEEKKAINDLNFIIVTDIYDNEVSIDKTKIINEYNKSVGIVLNLIKKQSKEIEKLKDKNKSIVYNYEMVVDKLENSTPNDKIKAKIEEYEEILQSPIIKEDYKKEVEHIIRVLKELKGDN